ncbi:unnamed protein product [Enterobius vermicularis]|uniref:Uncharacterized protein n=1 Tax=Enterobius vermicularis TaxID=51028 RepID=A0A0N4VFC4_ENTVE|nr:unnamed protein product [Enterobius vermicularis]
MVSGLDKYLKCFTEPLKWLRRCCCGSAGDDGDDAESDVEGDDDASGTDGSSSGHSVATDRNCIISAIVVIIIFKVSLVTFMIST